MDVSRLSRANVPFCPVDSLPDLCESLTQKSGPDVPDVPAIVLGTLPRHRPPKWILSLVCVCVLFSGLFFSLLNLMGSSLGIQPPHSPSLPWIPIWLDLCILNCSKGSPIPKGMDSLVPALYVYIFGACSRNFWLKAHVVLARWWSIGKGGRERLLKALPLAAGQRALRPFTRLLSFTLYFHYHSWSCATIWGSSPERLIYPQSW